MTDNILESVRSVLVSPDDRSFDDELTIYINGVFLSLNQMGIGSSTLFAINDRTEKWLDFAPDLNIRQSVKTYVILKVKLAFDPPTNSSLLESLKRNLDELEWRLHNEFNYNTGGGIQNG